MEKEMTNNEYLEFLNTINELPKKQYEIIRRGVLQLNEDKKELLSYIEQLEQCYCNRTDCSSRIKDSKKYDSLLQKYEQLEKEYNRLKAESEHYENKYYNEAKKVDKAIEYNEHLIEHAKYHLNLGHLKKMRKILKGDSDE